MDMENRTETTELRILTDYYKPLCIVLPVDELIPDLITERVISFEDEEKIANMQTGNQKAQVLLKEFIVRNVRAGDASKFYKFLDIIKKNDKCFFLAERIEKDLVNVQAGTTQWKATKDTYLELGPGMYDLCLCND